RNLGPPRLGDLAALHRSQIEPFVSGDIVDAHALAGGIGQSQIVKRVRPTLFRIGFVLRQRIDIYANHTGPPRSSRSSAPDPTCRPSPAVVTDRWPRDAKGRLTLNFRKS